MSTITPPDYTAIKKASQFAGLMTLGGACIVLVSIGYGVWRLGDTEATLVDEQKQVENLRADREVLETTLSRKTDELKAKDAQLAQTNSQLTKQATAHAELTKSIDSLRTQATKAADETKEYELQLGVLRKEASVIREELKLAFADPQKSIGLWAKPEYRGVMTTVLVRPTSRYRVRNDPSSPTEKWYTFTLQLEFPNDPKLAAVMKRDIKSVTYEMNHPYRKVEPLVSTKADENFAVQYEGAGTLRNVVVKIEVAGLGVVTLDYDMTKAHPEAKPK